MDSALLLLRELHGGPRGRALSMLDGVLLASELVVLERCHPRPTHTREGRELVVARRRTGASYPNESDRSKRHTPMRTNTTSVTGETKPRQESLGRELAWRRSREVTKPHKIPTFNEVYTIGIILRMQI